MKRRRPGKGMSLSKYRRGGAGMRIGYSMIESPVGQVLVAATDEGVCSVKIGDSESTLVGELRREYPAAEIAGEPKPHSEWVKAIAKHLRGDAPSLDLPIDVQATAFQWKVWRALAANSLRREQHAEPDTHNYRRSPARRSPP